MANKNDRLDPSVDRLRKVYGVRAGSTIYTTVKHVSRSGMSRTIAAYVVHKGTVHDVSYLVADAIGARFDRDRGGVIMGGCGMDMTFAMVYSLSRSLFPKGHRCNGIDSGKHRCLSNDHNNDYGMARTIARRELEDAGVNLTASQSLVTERAALVTEREGLTYRKGRVHSDGGYALNRGSL